MKNILLACLLLTALSCFSTGRDSTFRRHEFSVSAALGASQLFFDGPNHGPTNKVFFYSYYSGYDAYTPLPATHIQLRYSLGISPVLRLETGIGYLLAGIKIQVQGGQAIYIINTQHSYEGFITVPVHVKVIKRMPHGDFTCMIGPDFALPVHYFYRNDGDPKIGLANTDPKGHERFSASQTGRGSVMGFYMKLGYEKQVKPNLSVNVGPVVDFFQTVLLHPNDSNYRASGYYPYGFYAGLDVAINFGFSTARK